MTNFTVLSHYLKKYIVTKIFKLIINEYIKKTRITILLYPGFWGHFSNFLISEKKTKICRKLCTVSIAIVY